MIPAMAMNVGGGRHSPGRTRPMAEINVTPFVDVMLVLLIVFMVAAPLLSVGVAVDLPETAAQPIQDQGEPLTVTVAGDGVIYLQDTPVEIDDLVPRLKAIATAGYDQRIFIRGDRSRSYGEVVRVMGRINGAGFKRIGLLTEQEGAPASGGSGGGTGGE
ncbi:MAG: protein TolR [Pseudomonadota bacterium]